MQTEWQRLFLSRFFYFDLGSYFAGSANIFSFHRSQLISSENKFRVWLSVFLLLLMEVQVLRRLFETLYVFKYSPSARMHIFGYLTGLFFYTAMPLTLCCTCAPNVFKFGTSEVMEFIVKGRSSIQANEFDWWEVNPFLNLGWFQWIGAAIFLWGCIHQYRCHAILGSLREHVGKVDEYVIPCGDWFEIVSSPHYLAEIVIYAGVVFASGGDLAIWLLFGFVVSNLIFAAAKTHKWYLQKFDNYPSNRVAIIPFVC
ncbi:POLYPRENOL REDUCTASE 2-LIKE [Salix koriyanagi]|uniref:POLYPRENOL REDUCTASE 2-LIKE n=2 Tax=Salix koriyanagi TaxID=2511006 RepID=A0A9Q0UZY1_9ROSI|nr:POLYPRENOL REDUCTASE 2-LIKE [Salix koriyanagi]